MTCDGYRCEIDPETGTQVLRAPPEEIVTLEDPPEPDAQLDTWIWGEAEKDWVRWTPE